MQSSDIICPRCKQWSPPGTQYCLNCGEILDRALIAELQRLAVIMRYLDKRIAAGRGAQTVAALREEYFERYQDIRRARPAPAAAPAAQQPGPRASEQIPVAAPVGTPQAEWTPISTPAPVRPAAPAAPAPPPAAPAPVFSWQAFVSEQAIAIMAYLGGFLALVATLTFVVSKSATLPTLTLEVVSGVYVAFGVFGFGMRRSERLRTVSRVYLGVFALMTPLVALALYRFELQSLNVPVAGMLCISAVYAALVYLALAVQTRFITYAYLGWAALIVAAIAYIPWTHSDWQWWVFILGLVTLALLLPRRLRRFPALAVLGEPATQVAALTTIPTVIGVQALGIIGLTQTLVNGAFPTIQVQPAPLALGACILVPITAGWRLTVPGWRPRQQHAIIDTIDGFNAVFFAEAVVGVTIWIANLPLALVVRPVAVSLAATALFEFGLGLALYRWQPQRVGLRRFLEVLAVVLAGGGAFIVTGDPTPNWPIFTALSAALAVSVGAAIIDGAWWLLVGGIFLTFDYFTIASNLLPAQVVADNRATFSFALALALWCVAIGLRLRTRTRRLGAPVYLVAFGEALLTIALFSNQSTSYRVELLLVFTAASFSAGLREREPILGNVTTAFFGAFAAFTLANGDHDALHLSALAVGFVLAAMAARWRWGRVWALAPYAITLWAVVLTAAYVNLDIAHSPDWTGSGLPFVSWFLLFFALITTGIALWEKQPAVMAVPAALAFWALAVGTGNIASVGLDFGLLAAGAALRQWRGRWWGTALEISAVLGSALVVIRLNNLGVDAANWQVAFLLAFGAATYLIAMQEREPAVTGVSAVYALVAGAFLPGPNNLTSTLILTFGLAGVGAALRLSALGGRMRRSYSFAPYAAAIGCSMLALIRVVPLDAAHLEPLLLIFAAVSYGLVMEEGAPAAGFIPVVYALASIFVQNDPHALLPLAIIFAVLGLLAGRVAGAAWSWPFYAAAAVAGLMTVTLGTQETGFEAGALGVLAALTLVIALVESRPDVLPAALTLGVLALAAEANVLALSKATSTLAFLGLSWLYVLAAPLWRAIPWLRPRGVAWWASMSVDATRQTSQEELARLSDPRLIGGWVLRAGGYLLAAGTTFVTVFATDSFSIGSSSTLATVFALLSLAGMLLFIVGRGSPLQTARQQINSVAGAPGASSTSRYALVRYIAGFFAALAITWFARWLGADNIQAFIAAPGSYLLLVGAFLPADRRVLHAHRIGQFTSLAGAMLLMLPTLYQTFTAPDPNFQLVYGLVLLFESVFIIGLGVGLHARTMIYVGSAFIGIDVLSGVGLALRSGVSPAIVLAVLAAVLIGAATWLSLRPRHDASQ